VRVTTRPILAAVLTVLTLLASATSADARRPTGLEWQPCPEDGTAPMSELQCASLSVPADWSQPYGPRIGVAVARRPATDPGARIGTLIVNPGGPGGSGVDFALGADAFFSKRLRSRFDIVGFDPRGVARSSPVLCSASLVAAQPYPLLNGQREYDAAVAYNRELAADCRARTGPVFGHVDSVSVARDMDLLRQALGENTISFYGASYGTLLGQEYADRYPKRVRALALDSVMDHTGGTGEFLTTETLAAQDAFAEFVAWCKRDRTCALRGRDVPALWSALLARAAAGTLRDPYDPSYRLTPFDLVGVAFSSFYDPQYYALAYYLKEAAAMPARSPGRAAKQVFVVENSFPAIFCEDWKLPVNGYPDYRRRIAALRAQAPQMIASPLALSATVGCLGWPSQPDAPQRETGPARGPVLLINARHDPATAYTWARNVAGRLGDQATLVTYEGWGHVVYGRTPCVTGLVDRYLIERVRPAAGTSCAGVVPDPFGVGRSTGPRGSRSLHW